MKLIANKSLPTTSDEALIIFARENIVKILTVLEKKDPILCLKFLFPEQYGPLEITKYLSDEEMMPMIDALSLVIVDSYKPNNPKTDVAAAEELMARIVVQLGDDAAYLEAQGLQNREDYSKASNACIRFYELILSNDKATAANGLRYAFSP